MNKERLLRLAEHLETAVPEDAFDMTTWAGEHATLYSCGTAGCMAGHAASVPEFRELGLRLGVNGVNGGWRFPFFGKHAGYSAMAVLFDIPVSNARQIFGASGSMLGAARHWTPKKAASVLRKYVATGELP